MLTLGRKTGQTVEVGTDVVLKVTAIYGLPGCRSVSLAIARPGAPITNVLGLHVGDEYHITPDCRVIVRGISRGTDHAAIGFEAPASVKIWRSELLRKAS